MNMTIALIDRLNMRLEPLSLRNHRSISLRRLYISLSYCQGSTRVLGCGGTRE